MDSVGNIGSRKRVTGNHYSAEEQALDQIAKEVCSNSFEVSAIVNKTHIFCRLNQD